MGSAAVVVMAALAVGREGLETALFFFTAAQAAGQTTQPLIGFLLGIAVAVVLAFLHLPRRDQRSTWAGSSPSPACC